MLRTWLILLAFCSFIPDANAIESSTYSKKDPSYASYHSQVMTLYRNLYDGEGVGQVLTDSYKNYYEEDISVTNNVSSKVLINDGWFKYSDLGTRIDKHVIIEQYELRNLSVPYSDLANTTDQSDIANVARKSDFGGYIPKDCSTDPNCSNVVWVKDLPYSIRVATADDVDVASCPIGSLEESDSPLTPKNELTALLSQVWPGVRTFCLYDSIDQKIYHATNTESDVNTATYLMAGGAFEVGLKEGHMTQSLSATIAGIAGGLTTHNPVDGKEVNAVIFNAKGSVNAEHIYNARLNYTRGNDDMGKVIKYP